MPNTYIDWPQYPYSLDPPSLNPITLLASTLTQTQMSQALTLSLSITLTLTLNRSHTEGQITWHYCNPNPELCTTDM